MRRGAFVCAGLSLVLFSAALARGASSPIYSTYLGGSGDEMGLGAAVDSQGNFYVTGITKSSNYPTTANAVQRLYGGGNGDVFVAKFNSSGALVYSTYIGGSGADEARGVGVDSAGNMYVAGFTDSANFPTLNAFDSTFNGMLDAFLTKISPSGAVLFSTLYGGSGEDKVLALTLDPSGSVYLTGEADSTNFPATAGAFDTSPNGDFDAYVTKFSPAGLLVYSTLLGGPGFDDGLAITVDGSGNVFLTGKAAPGFPTTAGVYDTSQNGNVDMFVTKLNPAGSALGYSTYVGGNAWDEGLGIAVDTAGSAFITGNVQSPNYPVTPGAYKTTFTGLMNASVTKLNSAGSALVYSTLIGASSWTEGDGLEIDSSGNAYIAGHLGSPDLPTTSNAIQPSYGGNIDGFVSKVDPTGGQLLYSSYVGGSGWDGAMAFAIDSAGNAYVSGGTASSNYPVVSGAYQATKSGGDDAMATKISTDTPPPPPPPAPPGNTALPVVAGTADQGQTLSTGNGSWTNNPTSYTYQWLRCDSAGNNCANISSATSSSYVLTGTDVGSTIRSRVTATNTAGSTAASSNQTAAVAGVLTFSILSSGDDGDVAVRSAVGSGYPPTGSPSPYSAGTVVTAGRRNAFGQYMVYMPLLRFDTSAIPDNATVASASLKLRVNAKADTNSRNLVGEWYGGSNWPIDAADYSLNSTASAIAGVDITAIATAAVNTFALQGLSNLSKTGFTGFRLHVDGGAPTGDNYVQFAAFESSGIPMPQLAVRYTLP